MLPSADKLYGDADFIFQQDLAPAHTAKGTKSWLNDHGVCCEVAPLSTLLNFQFYWQTHMGIVSG